MEESILVAIGAVLGAAISSIVSGIYAHRTKALELETQKRANNTAIALQCAQLKHQQLMAVQDWHFKDRGHGGDITFFDPLQSVIDYLSGMKEYEETGKWAKAEKSHYAGREDRDPT